MSSIRIKRRIERAIESGPSWMNWLEHAAPAAHDESRNLRRALLLYQLPLLILLTSAIAAIKRFALFDPAYQVPMWLSLAGLTVLFWPLPAIRLGTAAHRCIAASPAQFSLRLRLRLVAGLCFIFACLAGLILIAMLWLALGRPGLPR